MVYNGYHICFVLLSMGKLLSKSIESLKNQSTNGPYNLLFDATEDKTLFTDENLGKYDAIMFVSTTGEGTSVLSNSFI